MRIEGHTRVVATLCAIAGTLAAGYLWAVVFGDGIPGLKGVAALNNSDSYPNANAAFLVALALYVASPVVAASTGVFLTRAAVGRWLVITGLAGAVAFALSRLFI
jgi:hypothetical protein